MEKWIVNGKDELSGVIEVSGSKNATLPIICASILADDVVVLNNVPSLTDVHNLNEIVRSLGVHVVDLDNTLRINPKQLRNKKVDPLLAGKLRASFLIAGSLLGKFGEVSFPLPGGCAIGRRPIDLHLKSFENLGATWEIKDGHVHIKGPLKAGTIFLDFPSVGATENAILAAVSIKGETTILNVAEEPEVMDLINFLNKMGADIKKKAGKTLVVNGGKKLTGVIHNIIPDRIEAGTWLTLSALTDGKVKVKNIKQEDIRNVLEKFKEYGYSLEIKDGIYSLHKVEENSISFQTGPHPSFPTDMQPQFITLSTLTKGMHIGVETVFENRFQHTYELAKMGADIKVFENKIALINGVNKLQGTTVRATDLRAGASLILAGLMAEGKTIIEDVYHIKRGYENILTKLKNIGATIEIVDD